MSWVECLIIIIAGVILFKPVELLSLYQQISALFKKIRAYFRAQETQLGHNIKLEWLNEQLKHDADHTNESKDSKQ